MLFSCLCVRMEEMQFCGILLERQGDRYRVRKDDRHRVRKDVKMRELVHFERTVEELVCFVEDTKPNEVVGATYIKLRSGISSSALLEAAALAVSRSTDLPHSHHGGPVHPVSGLYAIAHLAERNSGLDSFLPVIQSVALANKHIHSPDMGSTAMTRVMSSDLEQLSKDDLLNGFSVALEKRMAPLAERHLVALLKTASPDEILDAMLQIAIPRNALDDHYFLYTVYAFRALDVVGWKHAEVILRPPVRFLCRHPMLEYGEGERGKIIQEGISLYTKFSDLENLIEIYSLDKADLAIDTSMKETGAIKALAEEVSNIRKISETPALVAQKLAGGLSVMGVLEGLSVGGAMRFIRSNTGNPFDVHMHTGISARRYLLSLPGLSHRTRLLLLMSWGQGYEIRHLDRTLVWDLNTNSNDIDDASQDDLLGAIVDSLEGQPIFDLASLTGSIAEVVAPESVLETTALAQRYVELGYDPQPFFELMAQHVCRDDQSEMHAYKMQQATYEEFYKTRDELRGLHLVAAAKHAATVARLNPRTIYPKTRALMAD